FCDRDALALKGIAAERVAKRPPDLAVQVRGAAAAPEERTRWASNGEFGSEQIEVHQQQRQGHEDVRWPMALEVAVEMPHQLVRSAFRVRIFVKLPAHHADNRRGRNAVS